MANKLKIHIKNVKKPKNKINIKANITPKTRINLQKKYNNTPKIKTQQNSRPTIFELKTILQEYLACGIDIEEAAKICNISARTLGILRSDPEFDEYVQKCHAQCEYDHLKVIKEAGTLDGMWKASSWYLERMHPDKYGKVDTVKHEYELKLTEFKAVIMSVINELDPGTRNLIMQKLKAKVNSGDIIAQPIDIKPEVKMLGNI